MPKVKGRKPAPAPAPAQATYADGAQISSVIFGLVMVVAIIVAGAAMLGGSLSKMSERWGNAMDEAARSIGLSVDRVEVIGLEHVPALARQVRVMAMIEAGENMFRADPHLIQRRIEESRLVANVRVHRLWPDAVMIYADAAEPTALWNNGERWTVVDSLGRLMPKARAGDHAELLKATGVGAPEALPGLTDLLADAPSLTGEIDHVVRIAGRRWDLQLTSGTLVRLPSDEALAPGLDSLLRMNKAGDLTRRPLSAIDLRVPGRVFLTPILPSKVEETA